jgi:hypothetical protein
MPELLIRTASKSVENERMSTRPGDVVVVCRDGWPWSVTERHHPHWMIVSLPGSVDDYEDMTALQLAGDYLGRRRRYHYSAALVGKLGMLPRTDGVLQASDADAAALLGSKERYPIVCRIAVH